MVLFYLDRISIHSSRKHIYRNRVPPLASTRPRPDTGRTEHCSSTRSTLWGILYPQFKQTQREWWPVKLPVCM